MNSRSIGMDCGTGGIGCVAVAFSVGIDIVAAGAGAGARRAPSLLGGGVMSGAVRILGAARPCDLCHSDGHMEYRAPGNGCAHGRWLTLRARIGRYANCVALAGAALRHNRRRVAANVRSATDESMQSPAGGGWRGELSDTGALW